MLTVILNLRVSSFLMLAIDGMDQIQFPTIAAQTGLILAGLHPLFLWALLRLFQNTQAMGNTNFIVGLAVFEQVVRTLMELSSALATNAVHYQVVVEVVGVQVRCHHHLKVRELTLGQLQPDGVGLLRCEGIRFSEGLHKVIKPSAIHFLKPPFRRYHLDIGRLWNAIVISDEPESAGAGLLFLLDVFQNAAQHTGRLLLIFDCGECCHQLISVKRLTRSQRAA